MRALAAWCNTNLQSVTLPLHRPRQINQDFRITASEKTDEACGSFPLYYQFITGEALLNVLKENATAFTHYIYLFLYLNVCHHFFVNTWISS